MTTFALIGAAGYIAPRHMEAIKAVGGNLVAVMDPHDSVGILDRYFPDALYFQDIGRFNLFLHNTDIDYVVVCTPNYQHDVHTIMALRAGCNVICEKPLVLDPRILDTLAKMEQDTGKKVSTILQLRHHVALSDLKVNQKNMQKVVLSYSTPRGFWYDSSWKGDDAKSGGILFNIGIHLFDLLLWLYGKPKIKGNWVDRKSYFRGVCGGLSLERAEVDWSLSIDADKADRNIKVIDVDQTRVVHFTQGFTDLHIKSYEQILAGNSFGIEDVRPSIELVSWLRRDMPK